MQAISRYNIHEWIDGSPYAFQNWYHPSTQTVYPSHILEFYNRDFTAAGQFTQDRNFTFFNPQIIQPDYTQDRLCAAVQIRPTLLPQWIMVPCDEPITGASFVCESQINSSQMGLEKRTIFRADIECPRKTISIESSCLHVVNFFPRRDYMYQKEKPCGRIDFNVFLLPSFLFSPDPQLAWIRWSPEDTFLVTLLISMTHRWHRMFGENSEYADVIIGAGPQSSGKTHMVGLQYSESNLVHIQIVDMDRHISSSGLNILLCNHSMVVSNSLCLHGHAMCDDGTCILSHYVCDGRPDCPDKSDEFDCSHVCSFFDRVTGDHNCFTSCIGPECVCNDLYFSCAFGGCVPWSRVCNALLDCPNGEDEQMCFFLNGNFEHYALFVELNYMDKSFYKGEENNYKCNNGPNISHMLLDDLVADCPEQDDEEKYYTFLKNGSRSDFFPDGVLCKDPDAATCKKNYMGVCYPRHLHCIHEVVLASKPEMATYGTETCRNGAHLTNCEMYSCPSFFKCPSAYCIPVYAICNGKVDCPNGEDEANCQKISCPGFLLCTHDNVCVHPHDVWSGGVKCPISLDDKALNGTGACPDLCECLGNAIMCTKGKKLKLPKLPTTIRAVVIINTRFALDNLQWKGTLATLLHMQLSFCNISSVRRDHFTPLQFLQRLILRNNAIAFLPNSVFQHLSAVQSIDLGHNLISELHPSIFKGVIKVRILKLDFNKLTVIAPCTFHELGNLTALDLSNNYLTNLGHNVFCQLRPSIKELYFARNHLRNIDKAILESQMQILTHLDTTPFQICCFVPQVQHCSPKERFAFSNCRNLLGLAVRYVAIIGGIIVFFVSICSVVWIFRRMRAKVSRDKPSNRNLNNIFSLLVFICHGLKGIHGITLACVDIVFHNYYALHEEMWKGHAICILLNMFSYTSLMAALFLSLLISYTRMVACVFPFRLASVSLTKTVGAAVIFLLITMCVSYLPYSAIGSSNLRDSQMALGFGLILPILTHDQSLWSSLGYVFPSITILFVSSAFQISCIYALCKKPGELKRSLNSLPHRRKSVVRCIAAMVLPLCCQMPLPFLHIAAASNMALPPRVAVAMTLLTLHGYSVINATLHVAMTPAFIDFIWRYTRRIQSYLQICSHYR